MSLIQKNIVFLFKGSRKYIHGTDMFNALTKMYPTADISNLRFSVHDYVLVPECRIYYADSQEELNSLIGIRVRCQFDVGGVTQWLALAHNDVPCVSAGGRYEYDEDRVISLCSLDNDGITLSNNSPFSFIETVVAMNKYMHQQMFRAADGLWLFTRIDLHVGCSARENLALRFRHNMNFRLTKSDIMLDGQKVGDMYFSLVNR